MNGYYSRCLPVYVSSIVLGIVSDLINTIDGAANQESRFSFGFFILLPIGVVILSALLPRLKVKSTRRAVIVGAIAIFLVMIFVFWFYEFRHRSVGDMYGGMYDMFYIVCAIPAGIIGAFYGFILHKTLHIPDYRWPTTKKTGEIVATVLRGIISFLLFLLLVFLGSSIAPLLGLTVESSGDNYGEWCNYMLISGTFGAITALPTAILLLLKISDLKARKISVPSAIPIIAGLAYGIFFMIGEAGMMKTKSNSALLPFLLLAAAGSFVALRHYFSQYQKKSDHTM